MITKTSVAGCCGRSRRSAVPAPAQRRGGRDPHRREHGADDERDERGERGQPERHPEPLQDDGELIDQDAHARSLPTRLTGCRHRVATAVGAARAASLGGRDGRAERAAVGAAARRVRLASGRAVGRSRRALPSVPSYAFCQAPSPNAPSSVSLRNVQNALSPFLKPMPYGSSVNGLPTTFSLSGLCAGVAEQDRVVGGDRVDRAVQQLRARTRSRCRTATLAPWPYFVLRCVLIGVEPVTEQTFLPVERVRPGDRVVVLADQQAAGRPRSTDRPKPTLSLALVGDRVGRDDHVDLCPLEERLAVRRARSRPTRSGSASMPSLAAMILAISMSKPWACRAGFL